MTFNSIFLSGDTTVLSNVSLYGGTIRASNFSGADARLSAVTYTTMHGINTGSFVSANLFIATGAFRAASGTAIAPAFRFNSEQSLGFFRAGTGTITFVAASSGASINFNQSRLLSLRTIAASAITVSAANTNVRVDELVLTIGGASGASLAIHSGGTVYIFDSVSSAKAT